MKVSRVDQIEIDRVLEKKAPYKRVEFWKWIEQPYIHIRNPVETMRLFLETGELRVRLQDIILYMARYVPNPPECSLVEKVSLINKHMPRRYYFGIIDGKVEVGVK